MALHLVTYKLTKSRYGLDGTTDSTKSALVDCADEKEAAVLLEAKHPDNKYDIYYYVEILEFEPILSNQNTKKT